MCKNCSCTQYAAVFEAFGNQNRLHIINTLREKPKTVSEIIEDTGLEQTCVSHCLRKLEKSSIVSVQRKGKFRIYKINKETVDPIFAVMEQHEKRCK